MSALLLGKRVVVTGASRGLGRAIALAAAREGADVGVGYHERKNDAEFVTNDITNESGRRAIAFPFDVSSERDVESAVDHFERELGPIDGWVNNAGYNRGGLLVTGDANEWRQELEVNVLGPLLCARAIIKRMMQRRCGVIVNVSSVAAVRPTRGQVAYAACKGGVESMTRALAVEYAKKGIAVLCLRPGPIDTDMLAATRVLADDEVIKKTLVGRIASADEIAEHAVFMLSSRAAYATGSIVTVDGGYVLS